MGNITTTKRWTTEKQTALAAWMQARGLSDAELAAALKCDRSFVFRLRRGQRELKPCVRCRFLAEFGAQAAATVFGEDEDGYADAR